MKHLPHISDLVQSLRCFAITAKHGNQTEAARELGRTQPAVSQQLKHLEKELGVTLLQRQGAKLILTDTGNSLLQLCTEYSILWTKSTIWPRQSAAPYQLK